MALTIFIARHGQNEDNVAGVLNGHRDLPLTAIGRQQARDLAAGIRKIGLTFDNVYSSPLIRALETAQIISDSLGIRKKPIILEELIERDFGDMSGRLITEVVQEAGDNVIKTDGVTYVLDMMNGETFPQVLERGRAALAKVQELQLEGSALLVCHGDIGKMVFAAATEKPWEDVLRNFHFGNCDLIEVGENHEAHKIKVAQHNL